MIHDMQNEAVLKGLKRKAEKITLDVSPGKMVKKNKHCRASKAKWTADEDEILTRAVVLNGEGNWKKIAQSLTDRSHLQCLHRWQKVLNPALVKGPWKEEEDNKLVELVEKYGPKDWSTIASHIQGRIGKQCRERWFNHLSPEVRKTNWSPEEDRIIIEAHHRLGNKWTAISKLLDGRPANAIKNHWNSTLLKRIQDANGGLPSVRRERKNSKAKLSSFMPLSQSINTSTSSLGSFSSEEDDLSDDSDDSDVFSSPDSPESPVPLDSPVIQTRLPGTPTSSPFIPQQQYLQELQFQQQIHQAMLVNPFMGEGASNYAWEWNVPNQQQQINVHTGGATVPIAMNQVPVAVYNTENKFVPQELMELYHTQAMQNQQLQELQYALADASQVQNLNNITVEEFSPVSAEGNYGLNFLNLEMPGYCPLSLDI
eukprot:Phypoly_transcript_06736.p1 GENE.Phypoly_transcript_06736~~Phypoly_transcript_06736.p1  ORF type:complete len:427 (+),score=101.70 Phypoly_transcript_06736:177-1457(+)